MVIKPYLIEFAQIGAADIGFISVAEQTHQVPFKIERVFWTYYTPETVTRGRHAHYYTEQVLIAVAGHIVVTVEALDKSIHIFELSSPHIGLYLPPNTWNTMYYSNNAVQMVLASTPYQENDYIRNYEDFQQIGI